MGTSSGQKQVCTVVVTVEAGPTVLPELESHARFGLQRFLQFPGFLFGALHRSADGTRLVQYLQWSSEREYLACINHPSWEDVPSSRRFLTLVRSGEASMDVRVYGLVGTVGVPGSA